MRGQRSTPYMHAPTVYSRRSAARWWSTPQHASSTLLILLNNLAFQRAGRRSSGCCSLGCNYFHLCLIMPPVLLVFEQRWIEKNNPSRGTHIIITFRVTKAAVLCMLLEVCSRCAQVAKKKRVPAARGISNYPAGRGMLTIHPLNYPARAFFNYTHAHIYTCWESAPPPPPSGWTIGPFRRRARWNLLCCTRRKLKICNLTLDWAPPLTSALCLRPPSRSNSTLLAQAKRRINFAVKRNETSSDGEKW